MENMAQESDLQEIEIRLLLEGLHLRYGFDFRNYALASIRRRIGSRLEAEGVKSILGLLEKILHDPQCMERLLLALTVHLTSIFRDPGFYVAFRNRVLPVLRTYPYVRIWNAGCSSGEEVYSLAILMKEEEFYERCRIYATDMSEAVLERAKSGIYSLDAMKQYTDNYLKAGGKEEFSGYYIADHKNVIFRQALRENVVFAPHNLVSDASFNEFNVILCRNVMIYFNDKLQERVHKLLYDSLGMFGFLGLGSKESLRFSPYANCYEEIDAEARIYRKVR